MSSFEKEYPVLTHNMYYPQLIFSIVKQFFFFSAAASTASKSVNIKFRLGSISGSDNDSDQGNLSKGIDIWSNAAKVF